MITDFFAMMLLIFGFTFSLSLVAIVVKNAGLQGERRKFASRLARIPRFEPSHQALGADYKTGIAIDVESRALCLERRGGPPRLYKFGDLIACELAEDGDTVTRTSRASQAAGMAVGGLLMGGIGAVVGGLSGSTRSTTKVRKIDLRLILDDLDTPNFTVNFYTVAESFGVSIELAREEARRWYSRLRIIIERGDA